MPDSTEETEVTVADASVIPEIVAPEVTAQEAKTVGDSDVIHEADIAVYADTVPAQVMQPREGDSDVINVHEVFVVTDEVITDPSSPLAVQIPDAGRGSLDLPIHALARGTVEARFAAAAKAEAEEK